MSSVRIPRIPAELIPLIETLVGRPEGFVPHHRRTRAELESIRARLPLFARDFGDGSAPYNRALLVLALEYARAEILPDGS